MMKKMTAALAALSLLFAVSAYAEDNSALSGTPDAAAVPAVQTVSIEETETELSPYEQAVAAATCVPAESAGLAETCGTIAVGRDADLVLCDENWAIRRVWLAGQAVS